MVENQPQRLLQSTIFRVILFVRIIPAINNNCLRLKRRQYNTHTYRVFIALIILLAIGWLNVLYKAIHLPHSVLDTGTVGLPYLIKRGVGRYDRGGIGLVT